MSNSLFDQLKKSGLVDDKKAKKVKKEKYQQAKQQKGKKAKPVDATKLRAQQAQAEKVAHDRELNLQQQQVADQKAIAAQIKQLIEMNRIEIDGGEIGFNFTDENNVQRMDMTEAQRSSLVRGRLAIVKSDDAYYLVPTGVADKIGQRNSACIMVSNVTESADSDTDDEYADYQVPDDLMW